MARESHNVSGTSGMDGASFAKWPRSTVTVELRRRPRSSEFPESWLSIDTLLSMLMSLIICFLVSTAVSSETEESSITSNPIDFNISTTIATDSTVDYCVLIVSKTLETELFCSGTLIKPFVNQTMLSMEINSGIKGVFEELINLYKNNITEIVLYNLKNLPHLNSSTFRNLNGLKTLSISIAQSLKELPSDIFCGLSKSFNVLKIKKTNLKAIPDLSELGNPIEMHTIEFEGNNLGALPSNGIKTRSAQLLLENNKIRVVENWAFNGSEIGELSLKGNALDILSKYSFEGIINLRKIDLSDSLMNILPKFESKYIEVIRLERNYLLTTIPMYKFVNLKEAYLTYSFHCCNFQFPTKQDFLTYEFNQDLQQTSSDDYFQMKENNGSFNFESQDMLKNQSNEYANSNEDEFFLNKPTIIIGTQNFKYGKITSPFMKSNVRCSPKPDELNPCENIMGRGWLRISVWIVAISALLSNFVVLLVVFRKTINFSVPRLLMCNLAFADFCTALYLLILAYKDLITKDNYFNYAYNWQNGIGCKIAGFLTVFSSQLSMYTLCILTVERWYSIRKALYTTKLTYSSTVKLMAFGWIYAITMATLPLLGISSYSTTSICLPMDTVHFSGKLYVLVLLMVVAGEFLLMLFCYVQIYTSLSYETRHAAKGEASVAHKIFVLVGTNFACTAPVIFFGLTALVGYPLIDIAESKILLVFIYPINSCANPFLYTILTAGFRREVQSMVNNTRLYFKPKKDYKVIYSTQTNNNIHHLPVEPIQKTISSSMVQPP